MTFKNNLKNDMLRTFLNSNEFAEDITYTPKNGTAKEIKAVIERRELNPSAETANRISVDELLITITNDATDGVTSINRGGDKVTLPEFVGGTSRIYSVVEVVSSDDGSWKLLVRR